MKKHDFRFRGAALTAVLPLAALVAASPVRAEVASAGVLAPSGGGQGFLRAQVTGGNLFYKACAQSPCTISPGDPSVALPLGANPADIVIEPLAIGDGRHALWAHGPSWSALLAAAPGATEARVLWSGATGFSQGESGERFGKDLQVSEPEDDKTVHILAGEVREDVTICGRPSLLSPQVLDPKDLSWRGAKVQRLRRDERDSAPHLDATPSNAAPSSGDNGHLLQGVAASSGIGTPAALTDGDLETTWSENRGGDGKGEFVQMNAPEQVEITSVSIVARPKTRDVPKGAGPRHLWLATPDALFAVDFAEDPWAHAGVSYDVKLKTPLKTRCLAVVLDEAYVKGGRDPNVDVTLAEVTAHTEFDGLKDAAALVGALAGGQARARMAAAILARGGEAAYQAVIEGYPSLDDAGRVLALEIIDNAPCGVSAPLYVKALEVGRPGEMRHAEDRLLRCQRDGAPALTAAIASGAEKLRVSAANLLALVAPDAAVNAIVPVMSTAKPAVRAEFRAALAKASGSPLGNGAITAKLADGALPAVATIDLLRALAARPSASPEASRAFARLATPQADFRTRYLLLGPAAMLAKDGDVRAEAFLLEALSSDADHRVRARAADAAADSPKALELLGRTLADAEPRVRDAALGSLVRLLDPKGGKVALAWPSGLVPDVAKLLAADPFTFVRGHAAEVLLFAPVGEVADAPLASALTDAAPQVRERAVEVLGRRGSRAHASEIRDRLDDETEVLDVRVRAARALGRVCDEGSTDRLTDLARAAAAAQAGSAELAIGVSAAAALGRLNPPDLTKRLAPLADKHASRLAQEVARVALGAPDRCR